MTDPLRAALTNELSALRESSVSPMPDLAEAVARHQYGPHRCVGYFSEGNDRCIVNRLQAEIDRLRELEAAARWLVKIHADDVPKGSALWEDLQRLRAALDAKERA